jgi:hypothetical protein
VLEVDLWRGRKGAGRKGWAASPERRDQSWLETHGGAVVAVKVRVVVTQLFTRVGAKGDSGVEECLVPIRTADEAASADEHQGVPCRTRDALTAAGAVTTGDLIESDPAMLEEAVPAERRHLYEV